MMRSKLMIVGLAGAAMVALPAFAAVTAKRDKQTGEITVQLDRSRVATPIKTVSGTFKIEASFVINSSITSDNAVTYSASVDVIDTATGLPSVTSSASSSGVLTRSGNSGKATIIIPYLWQVHSATDKVQVNVQANATVFNETTSLSYTNSGGETLQSTLAKEGGTQVVTVAGAL